MRIKCAVRHQTTSENWELNVGVGTMKVMRSSRHSSQPQAAAVIIKQRSSDPETHNPRV